MDVTRILDAVESLKVLCIGDLMLDRFVYGSVKRISPEAPIPILHYDHEHEMPGAVGNVARNVAALGASVTLAGAVGDDAEGSLLADLIGAEDKIMGDLITLRDRPTTMKTRYVAGGQQLLRVDHEDSSPIDEDAEASLTRIISDEIKHCDLILVSDYAKGVLTDVVLQAIVDEAEGYGKPVIVDPKGFDFKKYGAVDILKPNASELSTALNMPCDTDDEVTRALEAALERFPAKTVLVTRSSKGLSYLTRGGKVQHLHGEPREVYDVSGAGDTTLAALGTAFGSNSTLHEAAEFALLASGIAVTKIGTATVGRDDLMEAEPGVRSVVEADLFALPSVLRKIERWREEGLRVGFTNGCFDILHPGHISVMEFARSQCDRLVVGLNSDASVRRLKGAERPVNSELNRARVLQALETVDAVAIFEDDTPNELIHATKPSVLVKGGDYEIDTIVGAKFVQSYGGEVKIAPLLDGHSTTSIIEQSRK